MTDRQTVLHIVSQQILALPTADRVARVAIDGVDGAGKTFFADELAEMIRAAGRVVIRASVDSFHHPRAIRYRLGITSPQGFYADSYDYETLKASLLNPLGPGGSGRYRTAAFDHETDLPVYLPERQAEPGSILIFDGIFLHRPELRDYWDLSVFLEVEFDVSVPRGNQRFGGSPDPSDESNRRYVEGQKIYLSSCNPKRHATLTIDNENLESPFIVTWRHLAKESNLILPRSWS
jgi:uridine kinase